MTPDAPSCSFCARPRDGVRRLLAGPSVQICDCCVASAIRKMIAKSEAASAEDAAQPSQSLYCSFCGKLHADVKCLAAGPAVFICDECVMGGFATLIGNRPSPRVIRVLDES